MKLEPIESMLIVKQETISYDDSQETLQPIFPIWTMPEIRKTTSLSNKRQSISKRNELENNEDARFECQYCRRFLTSNSMLTVHIKIHHTSENRGRFKCDYCELKGESKIFKLKTGIERHMKSHHVSDTVGIKKPVRNIMFKSSKEKNFNCESCDTFFGTRGSFLKHKRQFHPELLQVIYKCNLCGEKFRKQKTYAEHKRKHVRLCKAQPGADRRKRSTICDVCLLDFKTRRDMRLHKFVHCDFVEQYEEPGQQRFICALCQFDSYFEQDIEKHLPIHKPEFMRKAVLVCLKCTWTFEDYSMLKKHTELHNMKITHRCLRCLKKFPYGPKFLRHIERHLSYLCDLCGTNESSKGRLEDHIKVEHMKVVCHLCAICGKLFSL